MPRPREKHWCSWPDCGGVRRGGRGPGQQAGLSFPASHVGSLICLPRPLSLAGGPEAAQEPRESCCVPGMLAPTLAGPSFLVHNARAGPEAKGLTVWSGDFLRRWGADSSLPQQEPSKAPSMSSWGRNATCFIGERFVPRKGSAPNEKPPPATPRPQNPLCPSAPLCPCCPHFLPS